MNPARRPPVRPCTSVRQRALEERRLGRVEQQLQVVPRQNVELAQPEREPHPHTGARRAWREQRVEQQQHEERARVEQIQPQRAAMAAHEARAGEQRAERAPPILDDDPDARVVEERG